MQMETSRTGERLGRDNNEPTNSDWVARSEDIHVRNHDIAERHSVELVVRDDRGRRVFQNRYYLAPGQAESECDVLGSGSYVVEVYCDGVRRQQRKCHVGDQPDQTALIELGNGLVSVTEGIY
jgi:hypothetical protein